MTRWLVLMALTTALSGCDLLHRFSPPEPKTPEAWIALPPEAAASPWPDAEWWKAFDSETLTRLASEARAANFDVNAAAARVRQADAQARIAGAALLPAVDASGGGSRQRQSGQWGNSVDLRLGASYELDFWGRNRSFADAAEARAQASRFDQETVLLTVTSSVALTYFEILATQERLSIARANLANAERVSEAIRRRYEQGLISGLELAQQETVAANQRAAIPPLETRLRQNLNALAILLGKLPQEVAAPEGTLAPLTVPKVTPGLPSELLTRRPDIRYAEAQLAAAHADVNAARAAFLPSIGLTGAAGYGSGALSSLFDPGSALFSLAASLVQPIFQGGRLTGQLEADQARQEELLQNYHKSVVSAFAEVEDALAAVRHGAEETAARQAAEETARRAYALSERRLEGGIVDITSVLDTQRALFSAQDATAQAKLSHMQAIVSLYRALGGGWQGQTPMR